MVSNCRKMLVVGMMLLGGASFSVCDAQVPQLGEAPVEDVVKAMTIDEKVNLIIGFGSSFTTSYSAAIGNSGDLVPGAAGQTNAIPRLGIPATVLADGPAGLRINPTRKDDPNTYYCTHFPIGTLLASTWNLPLVEQVGKAMGDEVRQYGADVLLAPGTNIHRNPLCGRNFEYYSEDPLLAGEVAAAMINGIESNGVGTSLKHFVANNQETNRNYVNSVVDTRALREIYLKPFEIAVKKAQPWTIMTSYNKLNGTYTAERADLITELLRGEWGFEGVVMTDWYGGRNFPAIINSGNDMIQPGHPMQLAAVKKAIRQGDLRMDIIDQNVTRILKYIMQTPRFQGYKATNKPDLKAHAQVTRQAATEGMVLLKNQKQTLPMKAHKVALFGCTSYDFIAGGSGSGDVNRAYTVSLTEGLRNASIEYDEELAAFYTDYIKKEKSKQGSFNWFDVKRLVAEVAITPEQARKYARTSEMAIYTIGRTSGESRDRDYEDYHLTELEQQNLKNVCTAFHQAGKQVVVVLNVAGVIETSSWKHQPDAILLAWMGGQEGGNSVTDILTGKVSPSGKLTMTWPVNYSDVPSSKTFVDPNLFTNEDFEAFTRRKPVDLTGRNTGILDDYYDEGIYVGYRYYDTKSINVSYPFGYGLSYTSFAYGKPSVEKKNGNIIVTLSVKNTGKTMGKEIVQVYVSAPGRDMDKPVKELRGFTKTRELNPGESETVIVSIPETSLASFDEAKNAWVLEDGSYQVRIAASAADVRYSVPMQIEGRITEQCRDILHKEEGGKPHYTSIKPGAEWLDTDGKPIQAHGFSVVWSEQDQCYYWFGEDKTFTTEGSHVWTYGIRYYKSRDFYNWEACGHLLLPDTTDVLSPIHPSQGLDRPHIIYNKQTGKWVCWFKNLGDSQFFTVLEADRFQGPYEIVVPAMHPAGYESGDFDLYVDELTGKAYVWFERPHWELICAELTADYRGVKCQMGQKENGLVSHHFVGRRPPFTREAPTHFVHAGKHYLFTSGTTGYYPNESMVCSFSDYHGKYKELGNPHPSDTTNTSFFSQITDVIKIPGKKDLYVAVADRWMPQIVGTDMAQKTLSMMVDIYKTHEPRPITNDPIIIKDRSNEARNGWDVTSNARYVFLPITWQQGKPVIEWKDEWRLEDYD